MRALIILAALMAGTAAEADPAHGTWQTSPDDNGNFGHIEVNDCGDTICGVLVRAYDGSGQRIDSDRIGQRIVWNMVARGDGSYTGGKVYAPDRDRTYNSRMKLRGDRLTVEGCVLAICRGSQWKRVN